MRRPYLFLALLPAMLLALTPLAANAGNPSPAEVDQIEQIVRDYLKQHPEVIVEALKAYQARQDAAKADALKGTIASLKSELLGDPLTPVSGNPKGDVAVVEFFDYRCPYCKAMAPDLAKAVAEDGKTRLVYKEFPILSPTSIVAAKAALAARYQNKYVAFHDRLMGLKGSFEESDIYSAAVDVGLNVAQLKRDMAKPEIADAIARNYSLADKLDIQGTPAFVIGEKLLDGVATSDELTAAIKHARGG
jgi:protein-disulfide isomerase